jgi:molybdopterin/thiamine biosynthesis adenylyltransferase
MKITIIGVGALGSHLVAALRNEKVALKIIDFDRVEMKNVASQFHFKQGVNKKKVEALKQAMLGCYGMPLEVVGNKLTADNVTQLLGGADLLIDCLDNGESRKLVQDYARANKVPCLHGALAAGGILGRVVWDEHFVIDYGTAGAPTCEDGEFLPFIQIVSAWLALAAQNFIREGRKTGYMVSHGGVEKI